MEYQAIDKMKNMKNIKIMNRKGVKRVTLNGEKETGCRRITNVQLSSVIYC